MYPAAPTNAKFFMSLPLRPPDQNPTSGNFTPYRRSAGPGANRGQAAAPTENQGGHSMMGGSHSQGEPRHHRRPPRTTALHTLPVPSAFSVHGEPRAASLSPSSPVPFAITGAVDRPAPGPCRRLARYRRPARPPHTAESG